MPAGSNVYGAGYHNGVKDGFDQGFGKGAGVGAGAAAAGTLALIGLGIAAQKGIGKLKERAAAKNMKKVLEKEQLEAQDTDDDAGVEGESGPD